MQGEVQQPRSLITVLPKGVRRSVKQMLMSPPFAPLRRRYSGLASILMYHRIVNRRCCTTGFDPNLGLSVHIDDFEAQLAYIAAHHRCLSLPDAVAALSDGTLAPGAVVITFDDGYRDNLELAVPLLEKYGLPATIYVATGVISGNAAIWWYEQEFIVRQLSGLAFRWRGLTYDWPLETRLQKDIACEGLNLLFKGLTLAEQRELMEIIRSQSPEPFSYKQLVLSWDELRALDANPLITIGAHTVNHPNLKLCSDEEARGELLSSRLELERELGHEVLHAAYPFGSVEQAGPREFAIAKALGFASACTTALGHVQPEHRDHVTALPRICIDYFDRLERFCWKLSGCHAFLQQKGRRIII